MCKTLFQVISEAQRTGPPRGQSWTLSLRLANLQVFISLQSLRTLLYRRLGREKNLSHHHGVALLSIHLSDITITFRPWVPFKETCSEIYVRCDSGITLNDDLRTYISGLCTLIMVQR